MTPEREAQIEWSASQLRAKLFVYSTLPLNLKTVIARIGDLDCDPKASVKLLPVSQLKYDAAFADCDTNTITLPDTMPEQLGVEFVRNRFTLAHELAHVVLGHSGTRSRAVGVDFRRQASVSGVGREEAEANVWAGAFLMPELIVKSCNSAAELAVKCGVSVEAARIRMELLERRFRRAQRLPRRIPPATEAIILELRQKAGVVPKAAKILTPEPIKQAVALGQAKLEGYLGTSCAVCGKQKLLREGGCVTCQECGDSNCN